MLCCKQLKEGGANMRAQKINYRILFAISLILCLLMAVIFSNGALAAAPGKATLVSPVGTISNNTPTYTWNAVSNSRWYNLLVIDSTGTSINEWYSAAQTGCGGGSGLCSITPSTALAIGSGKWWIQTWNSEGSAWSNSLSYTLEKGFDEASIQGSYAFTAMDQGGAPAPSSDSVVQEAAMGIISANGKGGVIGKISWNMYDFLDQVPDSDRLVLHRFPFTGTYTVEDDGFGTFIGSIDFDQDEVVDVEMTGKLVITKTKDQVALEFWFIGDPPPTGESIVIIHFFKREQ